MGRGRDGIGRGGRLDRWKKGGEGEGEKEEEEEGRGEEEEGEKEKRIIRSGRSNSREREERMKKREEEEEEGEEGEGEGEEIENNTNTPLTEEEEDSVEGEEGGENMIQPTPDGILPFIPLVGSRLKPDGRGDMEVMEKEEKRIEGELSVLMSTGAYSRGDPLIAELLRRRQFYTASLNAAYRGGRGSGGGEGGRGGGRREGEKEEKEEEKKEEEEEKEKERGRGRGREGRRENANPLHTSSSSKHGSKSQSPHNKSIHSTSPHLHPSSLSRSPRRNS